MLVEVFTISSRFAAQVSREPLGNARIKEQSLTMHQLVIHQLSHELAVVRLPPEVDVPAWAWKGRIAAVVRTPMELSIVCDESVVPKGVQAESGWTPLMLEGPFPFSMTGVLASVLTPLATAEVSVFALSTFDTDYVLIKTPQIQQALDALTTAGHIVKRSGI